MVTWGRARAGTWGGVGQGWSHGVRAGVVTWGKVGQGWSHGVGPGLAHGVG